MFQNLLMQKQNQLSYALETNGVHNTEWCFMEEIHRDATPADAASTAVPAAVEGSSAADAAAAVVLAALEAAIAAAALAALASAAASAAALALDLAAASQHRAPFEQQHPHHQTCPRQLHQAAL
jgi:hypothetical protein